MAFDKAGRNVRVVHTNNSLCPAADTISGTVTRFLASRVIPMQLDQHCIIYVVSERALDSLQIDAMPICSQLDAIGKAQNRCPWALSSGFQA
jgi:hypothetical protein